jgi:diadenosine tetraphosphatase ApaH/serine/threonine PP2A family protein phosphatase
MENEKKKIGEIEHYGKFYDVLWDLKTKYVWCRNSDGRMFNYHNIAANFENEVIDVAKKMLENSGI